MSETADASQTPSIPIPPPAPKNTFQRIAGVLFAPASTFEDIARKPNVIGPLLVILAVTYISLGLTMSHMDWDAMIANQQEMMKAKNPNMTQSDLDRMARMTKAMAKVGPWFAGIFIVATTVIVAGVLLLAFRLFGGGGGFMQAWSAVLYAWMPRVILGIIGTIVVMARGMVDPIQMKTIVKSSPAFLVDMKEHPAIFSLLSALDIFTIWSIILLIIGFAALSKTSRAKAAAIIVGLWAVVVLAMAGFAGLMGKART